MYKKRPTKELLTDSALDLLRSTPVGDITVAQIAEHCGVSQRAFYNHFRDKYDVMSWIYLREMEPHLMESMEDWYLYMSDLFDREWNYFENAQQYYGQNSLSDTIFDLDFKKYMLHVKESILSDPKEKVHFIYALNHMLYGNVGNLRKHFIEKKNMLTNNYLDEFGSTWLLLRSWFPPILLENVEPYPVRDLEGNLVIAE